MDGLFTWRRGGEYNISEANSIFFQKRCQKVLTTVPGCGIESTAKTNLDVTVPAYDVAIFKVEE